MVGTDDALFRPIDQKLIPASAMATIESYIATSTYWPSPIRSRCRRAASTPNAANTAVPVSPMAPRGEVTGGSSGSRLKLYRLAMASATGANADQPAYGVGLVFPNPETERYTT